MNDYAAVVTPPYRGVNQLQLYGWHFRNADNSGPNAAGPKNLNAPQELRSFRFVLSREDFEDAAGALARLLWGPAESEDVARHLQTWRRELAKGGGPARDHRYDLGQPDAREDRPLRAHRLHGRLGPVSDPGLSRGRRIS